MELLETKRLIARVLTSADAEFILRLCNEPAFIRGYRDWQLKTVTQAEEFMQRLNDETTRTFALVLKESGTDIGIFTFTDPQDRAATEFSVAISRSHEGNQYSRECFRGFIEYAARILDCQTVFCKVKSHKSPKALERAYGVKFQTIIDSPDGSEWNFYSLDL